MTATHSTSFPASTDRHGPISVALIGDTPLARALGEALTGGGVPMRLCQGADDLGECRDLGLVIEASGSNADDRAEALHEIEHAIGGEVPIAALLSTDTLSSLAQGLHQPGRLIGASAIDTGRPIGFVEIVRGDRSTEAAVAVARALFDLAGVRSIVTHSSQEPCLARMARRYVNEGLALLGEGVPASVIEKAAQDAGMSLGPLALLDVLSLDEADRVLHQATDHDSHRHEHGHAHGHEHGHGRGHRHSDADGRAHEHEYEHEHEHDPHKHLHGEGHEHDPAHATSPSSPRPHGMTAEAIYVLEKMAHGLNRMGKHAGRGFYEYDEDDEEAPSLWSGLKSFERRRVGVDADYLRDRLLYVQSLEALRCLEESVVASVADANLASVLGLGFPDGSDGAIGLVDRTGPAAFLQRTRELALRYGDRFDPPDLLERHARGSRPFAGASR